MTLRNIKGNTNKEVLLLFFLQPFIAFLMALSNLRGRYSFKVIMLFFVLFGYTFIAHNETADSYGYVEDFKSFRNVGTSNYFNAIKEYFTFESSVKDIYALSSNYLVSRMTDSYHFLLALWAFVFSFFFLKSFRFLIDRPEWNKSVVVIIITFLFFYSNPITNINGVRFWTAAWVGVYAIFEIIINKNYRYLLLALLTPLIHITYISFVVVMLVYLISIKYDKLWVIVFIISFFVGNIAIELLQGYSGYLPKVLQNLVWSYTMSGKALQRMDGINLPLYAMVFNKLPYFFINGLIFMFISKSRVIKKNSYAYSGYLFILVWMSFVNFTLPIPSFGGRFFVLGIPFIMYVSLIMYRKIPQIKTLFLFAPLIYSYSIFQWFRFINSIIDYDLLYSVFPHLVIKNFSW